MRFRQVFFIWWLKRLKNTVPAKFELLSFFVTPKMDIFIMRFYENQKNSAEIGSKRGQNRWKRAVRSKITKYVVRKPEKNDACKISAFYHFLLPKKRTFLPWFFTKIDIFEFLTFRNWKIHHLVIFQDIELKFEIWVDNSLKFPKLLARFFDFGL